MSMMLKRDPFENWMPLRDAMNRILEESFIWPERFEVFTGRSFPVDVYEAKDKQSYVVEASLPGVKPEELSITAMGDTLTIRYTTKKEEKVEKEGYVRRERYEGDMGRSITLPTQIEPEKVEANYEHGVLTLRIPKVEVVKPKQIAVKVKQAIGAH